MFKYLTSFVVLLLSMTAMAGSDPVAEALRQSERARVNGMVPVAVFDLDETLIDSGARRALSLQVIARRLQSAYPDEAMVLEAVRPQDVAALENTYDNEALYEKLGINNLKFIQAVESEFLKEYLSSKYMGYDSEIPCATWFIRELHKQGVYVVFISSRYDSRQRKATLENLSALGMIRLGDRYDVMLRPDGMASIDFKKQAFAWVNNLSNSTGEPHMVVLAGENEPKNMNAMGEAFPDAMKIFVKGAYEVPAPVKPFHHSIDNYCTY